MSVLAPHTISAGQEKTLGIHYYFAWRGEPDGLVAEGVKIHRTVLQGHWLILTPGGHRIVVSQSLDPRKNLWTVRFADLESGWWAEEIVDFPFEFEDFRDLDRRFWDLARDSDALVSEILRTAEGDSFEFIQAMNVGSQEEQSLSDVVGRTIQGLDRADRPNVPLSAIEGIRFLLSLKASGAVRDGESFHAFVDPLAVLVNDSGESPEVSTYEGVSWIQGKVHGTSRPAVKALLDRFDRSEEAKGAIDWLEDRLRKEKSKP